MNLHEVPVTHINGLGGPEVPMTKHRTITGFVAVALLAVATTVATIRSSPTARVMAGGSSLKVFTADENRSEAQEFERPLVGTKKAVRYEAIIDNWKRYRSATKSNE